MKVNKMILQKVTFLILILAGLLISGCKSTVIEINNTKISSKEYEEKLESFILPSNSDGIMTAGEFVTRQIILDELIKQFAERKDLMPGHVEIENEIKKLITISDGKLEILMSKNPQTAENLRNRAIIQLCMYNILTYNVKVSDVEIINHYNECLFFNPEKYLIPEKRFVSIIAVSSKEDLEKVIFELNQKNDFKEIAEKYNTNEFKEFSIPFAITRKSDFINSNFIDLIFNTKQGTYSKPVPINPFFIIVKIDKVEKAKIISLDEAKKDIKFAIALEKGRANPVLQDEFINFVKTSKIKVVNDKYKEIVHRFKMSDLYSY